MSNELYRITPKPFLRHSEDGKIRLFCISNYLLSIKSFRQIRPSTMAISTLRRHQANCGIFSVVPQGLGSPNAKSLNQQKEKRRGQRNTFLLLPSVVPEGAGTLVEDAALPLCDPGSIGGVKCHLFTIYLFSIRKFRCDKSNKVNGKTTACLSFS